LAPRSCRGPRWGRLVALLVAFLLAFPAVQLAFPTAAAADQQPTLVTQQHTPPRGFRLTAARVERIAARAPAIQRELRLHRGAIPYEYTRGPGQWQVSWFSSAHSGPELAQVYVDDATGKVTEAWTGFQVAWTMARGYPGAFGRISNALYIWLPLCFLFVVPFVRWRGLFKRRSWSLLHLDLLVLLAFSISLAFFNHANIGVSVPLVYPFLFYLLVRLLLLAAGRGRPREALEPSVRLKWLVAATVVLFGLRIALNVVDSNVIDVGYAGVIGSHRVLHGQPLYGVWPSDNANGDTYGPVTYYAYAPFTAIFGWSGTWDSLPAAHAAAIAFDLLVLVGLYLVGHKLCRPGLGALLGWAWVSYPFTLFALSSNSNDALVGFLVLATLLAVAFLPARGSLVALAGMTKFAPFGLVPLLARGVGPQWPRKRALVGFVGVCTATVAATLVPVFVQGNFARFWHDTIAYQATRPAPFSIWGLYGGLSIEQHVVQGLAVLLAVAVAFVPRRRSVIEAAALGAAVLIAIQLGVTYWFYLYIMWFLPLALLALFGAEPLRLREELTEEAAAVDGTNGRVGELQPALLANARGGHEQLLDRGRPQRPVGGDEYGVEPGILG
jgi:uncharacterized membrane protein